MKTSRSGGNFRALAGQWYRRARCFRYQWSYSTRSPYGFMRSGLRGMKGLPLLGSLRMLSLGFLPHRQWTYGLGQWPSQGRVKQYLTDWQREKMFFTSGARMSYRIVLDDKVRFTELVSGFAVTPKLLAVVQSGRVFPTSADVPTPDADGLVAAARVHEGLVLKPRDCSLGIGILFLVPASGQLFLNREPVQPADLRERIRSLNSYIATTRVRQAPYAARLFSKTTNTIRVLTMIDPVNGEAFPAYAVHRIGTEASYPVDNCDSGGIYCLIDLETGRLSHPIAKGGKRLDRHPDTGMQIEGVAVPGWSELLESIVHLAQKLDFIDYAGWDVVVTDDGFTVLEGNYNPGLHQMFGPILVSDRVRAFYRHHLSFKKRRARGNDR
jgi:hypothetical protein